METHEFTVVATGLDPAAPDFEGRFLEAGCDDATVSFQKGRILVDFSRAAVSLEAAVASAVADVCAAGARVERIEPDPLVSLADMAGRARLSRSALTHYFRGHRVTGPGGEGFPAPRARVTTDSPLWDWADASAWLYRQRRLSRRAAVDARVVSEANALIGRGETEDFGRRLGERVRAAVEDLD